MTKEQETPESTPKKPRKMSEYTPEIPAESAIAVMEKPEPKAITVTPDEIEEFRKWKSGVAITDVENSEAKAYKLWKEESRMVKGVFRYREVPGGMVEFNFRKFKWDPVQKYTLYDGQTYTIPLAVARHLNNNCKYEVHSRVLGPDGQPTLNKNEKVSRMGFESLEFN